eukprot:scaffold2938_cov125-Isochrysis_galbana.AAC.1
MPRLTHGASPQHIHPAESAGRARANRGGRAWPQPIHVLLRVPRLQVGQRPKRGQPDRTRPGRIRRGNHSAVARPRGPLIPMCDGTIGGSSTAAAPNEVSGVTSKPPAGVKATDSRNRMREVAFCSCVSTRISSEAPSGCVLDFIVRGLCTCASPGRRAA